MLAPTKNIVQAKRHRLVEIGPRAGRGDTSLGVNLCILDGISDVEESFLEDLIAFFNPTFNLGPHPEQTASSLRVRSHTTLEIHRFVKKNRQVCRQKL